MKPACFWADNNSIPFFEMDKISLFGARFLPFAPLTLSLFLPFALCLLPLKTTAQAPAKPTSGDIFQSIKKLQVLGSVCFVAAHPDDENTRLISYLANERLFDVTYLSLTRGDGGQNLIGPEMRELLGVIRTQELLAARRIDGGKQLFSRANDYGFSKKPSEAFRTWDREEVLEDVVWAFRKLQPDVVINRFTTDTSFENHGHHTASAILSYEAFDLAGKREIFPKQFAFGVEPWQPRRIFFNTSWWFYGSREKFDAADKSNLYPVDLGVFFAIKRQIEHRNCGREPFDAPLSGLRQHRHAGRKPRLSRFFKR